MKNKAIKFIVLLFFIFIIAFFFFKNGKKEDSVNKNINENNNYISPASDIVSEVRLMVDPYRCIGCGKCAQVASTNFKIVNGKSTVISEENADSSSVARAITKCPARAISLK